VTAIDFPYMIIEVMHFYKWSWEQIMHTPLRLFWTLMKQMHRIKAGENLRWYSILAMSQHGSEDDRRNFIASQTTNIGVTHVSEDRDEEGIAKLKNM